MRILNFKFMEKWCSDKARELDWGIEHIKQWQPNYSSLIYKGDYNILKGTLVTVLVISFPYANANNFSLVNATLNDTHVVTTTQHGDELFTTIITNNYTIHTDTGPAGEFIGETITYINGSKEIKAPYRNGKATMYTEKDSQDVKIIYAD